MAEPRVVPLPAKGDVLVVHKPVTRRRGRPPKQPKQPSTRDQVAQTLVELRPTCTSAGVNMATSSSSSTSTAANATVPVPSAKTSSSSLADCWASLKNKEEKFQFLGAAMDEAMREVVEPLVRHFVRQDPRTGELIEVKKDLKEIEAKLEENKHFDQRVLEEGQKMKRHFDEALAELAPLKKRLLTEVAPPTTPDPRVDKLEKQNAELMARMSAMEARLGAIEVEGK